MNRSAQQHLFFALLITTIPSFKIQPAVLKESLSSIKEEYINGSSFKHQIEIENGVKKEQYFVNGKSATAQEFEDALLNAEKEESKRERRKHQEKQIRRYETQYKANVKIAQSDLKKATTQLADELTHLEDGRLKQFLAFSPQTLSGQEQVADIKDRLSQAKKLLEVTPETIDIKKIHDMRGEINSFITRVHDTFIATLNNGINKADDTKLLKELLTVLADEVK